EEEAAAPSPDELAAQCAVVPPHFIPAVDARVGDLGGAALLVLPVDVQQLAEAVEIADLQGGFDLQSQGLGLMETLDDVVLCPCRVALLFLQDVHRLPLD